MSIDTVSTLERLKAVSSDLLAHAQAGEWEALQMRDTERVALLSQLDHASGATTSAKQSARLISDVMEMDRQLLALSASARNELAAQSRQSSAQRSALDTYKRAGQLSVERRD